ncbi:uncharacterized protein [Arachis hypogaea]|uniref:uncharacterized protein isoform X2 n=1 Tax=Arachis hypogaea TaxID=3818 RepID=UPI000DEC2293|nr:uncharacterized protein LOC112702118 [Arachis hypogaea]
MERQYEEVEDKDRLVISKKILNEWNYEYLSPDQMKLVTYYPHNSGIHGSADLLGYEESTKRDSEVTVSWNYCCKTIGLAKECPRPASQKSSHGPSEDTISSRPLLGHEPKLNSLQYDGGTGTATGPGCMGTGQVGIASQRGDALCPAAATHEVLPIVGGMEPRLRPCPEVGGCDVLAGRAGPMQRRGTGMEGGDDGLMTIPTLPMEAEPCESAEDSDLDSDDRRRKFRSRGDLVMEVGCSKLIVVGVPERGRGSNGRDEGQNNRHCNDASYENSDGVQRNDCKAPEFEATCHRTLPELQDQNELSDDKDSKEGRKIANVNEVSDSESSKLKEQLIENKRVWELAKEPVAELYDEEEDIMAVLQQQNEEIARKKRLAKQKAKARRSRPKTQKKKKAPSSVSSVPQFGGWDQRDPGSTNYSMVFAQARANKKSMKNDLTESIKRASLGSDEEFLNANANANHAQGKSHANANAIVNVNHAHQDEPLGMGRRRIPTFIDCCIRPRYVIE